MNSYFLLSSLNNKSTVTIFILCLYLLQVQTDHILNAVLADLNKIKSCSKIEASLYTAEMTGHGDCKESVMRCFFLEMQVILYESMYGSDKIFTNTVRNVLKNINQSFPNETTEISTCKKCETFEEKKCTEFLKRFEYLIQQLNNEPARKKQNS